MPEVAVDVWYKAGSRDEAPGHTGFAHLFEHIMFQGTKHIPEDKYFEFLQKAGASNVNGSTAADRTNYYEVVPANQLELALWLESDRMGFLLERPSFKETLDNQRDVVKNERRQSYENRPDGLVFADPLRGALPARPPLPPPGDRLDGGSLGRVGRRREGFFRTYYAPGNATLTVAGDIDRARPRSWSSVLRADPRRRAGRAPGGRRGPPRGAQRIAMEAKIQQPQLYVDYPSPANFAPGDRELDLLANILGNGKSCASTSGSSTTSRSRSR